MREEFVSENDKSREIQRTAMSIPVFAHIQKNILNQLIATRSLEIM